MKNYEKTLVALLVTATVGCASVTKNNEQQSAGVNDVYKSGDTVAATRQLNASFNTAKLDPKKDKIDTTYYLEKGTFQANAVPAKLPQSTANLLVADLVVSDWENRAALSLRMSPAEFANAMADDFKQSNFYQPRDYEKSFVNYMIATNHLLAERFDLALPGAQRIREREEVIRNTREKLFVATREELNSATKSAQGVGTKITSADQIPGYDASFMKDPEVAKLRNSYSNAASYYLAGFIFEREKEPSLAETSYKRVSELIPNAPILKVTPKDGRSVASKSTSEVLIIVDTGFLPDVYSFKAVIPFWTPSGPKAVTWVVPSIKNNGIYFKPSYIGVDSNQVPLSMVANVDAMAKRELKDQMPTYITRAIVSSILQIAAQEAASQVIDKKAGGNPLLKLLTTAAVNAIAAGDVDTRMWKSLPANVYMARVRLPKGEHTLALPGVQDKAIKVSINDPYEVVHARVFANGKVAVNASQTQLSDAEYNVRMQAELKE